VWDSLVVTFLGKERAQSRLDEFLPSVFPVKEWV
jgi:hypothetical protein